MVIESNFKVGQIKNVSVVRHKIEYFINVFDTFYNLKKKICILNLQYERRRGKRFISVS